MTAAAGRICMEREEREREREERKRKKKERIARLNTDHQLRQTVWRD
jgi:hypothetical protein